MFSKYWFTDVDECETNNGGCPQVCLNTIGSYSCKCRDGFIMDEDSCKGFHVFFAWIRNYLLKRACKQFSC